jgi:CheY-like chemotaxis protein
MSYRETEHLRVLIANERKDRLALVAPMVTNLGHEVIAREIDVADVGAVTASEGPDVALVGLGRSSEHALAMIDQIVQEAACPVILLIHARDPAFVQEASKRGIFAYITDAEVDDWQNSAALRCPAHASVGVRATRRHPYTRVAHPAGGRKVAGSNPVAPIWTGPSAGGDSRRHGREKAAYCSTLPWL